MALLSAKENAQSAPLSGTVLDDTGAPVTDAVLSLQGMTPKEDGSIRYFRVQTDAEGRYKFADVNESDTYRLMIECKSCIGTDYSRAEQLAIDPAQATVKDFTLKRACQVRLFVANAAGQPVEGAYVHIKLLAAERYGYTPSESTDKFGWVTLGGVAPAESPYIIGVSHKDYALAKVEVTLDDPTLVVPQTVLMEEGEDVEGTAICSDGEPAAGWSIVALPSWWQFNSHPGGAVIDAEGKFTLTHITPGSYDLNLSIPQGGGMSSSRTIESEFKLPPAASTIELKLKQPSPKSLTKITGRLKFTGVKAKKSLSVEITSSGSHISDYLQPGETEFTLANLPPGKYTISVTSPEIETATLTNVTAPSEGIEIPVKVVGAPELCGQVVDGAGRPLSAFRYRIFKTGSLRGIHYSQDASWRAVANAEGKFTAEVVGPGIYRIEVAADGWAPTALDKINSDEVAKDILNIQLSRGISASGTVVDQQGEPVDGATVTVADVSAELARYGGRELAQGQTVMTEEGTFELVNLPKSPLTLRITHPDYCATAANNLPIENADVQLEPLVMKEGGTIRGTLYDAEGEPMPNTPLVIQDQAHVDSFSGRGDVAGRLAIVVTDEAGEYEADHLPEKLIYVVRNEEWQVLGVVRSAILAKEGEVRTLDLGGPNGITGRILLNGKPLAEQRVMLANDRHSGAFGAYAKTDADGRFKLPRPPVGQWKIWYQRPNSQYTEYGQTGIVRIDDDTTDLGDIKISTAEVTVIVPGITEEELSQTSMYLAPGKTDPMRSGEVLTARATSTAAGAEFKFLGVPVGKCSTTFNRASSEHQVSLHHELQVPDGAAKYEERITLPTEMGSLVVKIDPKICNEQGCPVNQLRGVPLTASAYLQTTAAGGEVRVEKLPVGDYFLTDEYRKKPRQVLELAIKAGEVTTVELSPENYQPRKQGAVGITCYTSEGIPLPGCTVRLRDDQGHEHNPSHGGDVNTFFSIPAGDYQLEASCPGFTTGKQQVTIDEWSPEARSPESPQVDVFLTRD